jgi:hypothetical protein
LKGTMNSDGYPKDIKGFKKWVSDNEKGGEP